MPRATTSSSVRFIAAVALAVVARCAASAAIEVTVTPDTHGSPLPFQYAPGTEIFFQKAGTIDPTASLQWLHNDQPIAGATQSTLTLSSVTAADTGNYQLQSKVGTTVERSRALTINVLPIPPAPVDTMFNAELPANTRSVSIEAIAQDHGLIMLASLGEPGSSDTTLQYLRLRADGSRDLDFALPQTARRVLAALPNGGLIIAGPPFRTQPNGSDDPLLLPAGFDSAKELTAATIQPDGKLLIAQDQLLSRLNADGSADTTFSYAAVTNGPIAINGLKLDRSGRVYVSARQINPVPSNHPQSWQVVFRLTADGQRDSGFAGQAPILLSGSLVVEPLADGRIFYHSRYHGYVSWRVLRDDGTPDPSWTESHVFSDWGNVMVDALDGVAYQPDTSGVLRRYVIGASGLEPDAGFFPGQSASNSRSLAIDQLGRVIVSRYDVTPGAASPLSLIRLLPDESIVVPPRVGAWARYLSLAKGSTVTLVSDVFGTGPFTYEWRALDGQPLPQDHFSAELNLTPFQLEKLGRYQLKVIGAGGGVLSQVVTLEIDRNQAPYLANISGRARTGKGEDTVIAGLVVHGTQPGLLGTTALVRGVGPGLRDLGVTDAIVNPAIDAFDARGTLFANNDQWSVHPDVAEVGGRVGAFPLKDGSFDAGFVQYFPHGSSTIMLRDQGQGDGVGLLEIYQSSAPSRQSELANLSFRARTAEGDDVAIAGFVVVEPLNLNQKVRVLLRAIGPTLSTQGIAHPIANPVLNVFNVKGEKIASNDDWAVANTSGDQDALAAAMKQVGAFELPAGSKDAALLLDLPAGAYTMHANGGTGVVLIEIYLVR